MPGLFVQQKLLDRIHFGGIKLKYMREKQSCKYTTSIQKNASNPIKWGIKLRIF